MVTLIYNRPQFETLFHHYVVLGKLYFSDPLCLNLLNGDLPCRDDLTVSFLSILLSQGQQLSHSWQLTSKAYASAFDEQHKIGALQGLLLLPALQTFA